MPGNRRATLYAVAGGVVFRGDETLVLRLPSRGEVRLPKGHVEDGETVEQAAVREVAEETGYCDLVVEASLGAVVNRFLYNGAEVRRMETYFLMGLVSPATRPRNGRDEREFVVEWLSPEAAVGSLTFESERQFVRRAMEARRNWGGGDP